MSKDENLVPTWPTYGHPTPDHATKQQLEYYRRQCIMLATSINQLEEYYEQSEEFSDFCDDEWRGRPHFNPTNRRKYFERDCVRQTESVVTSTLSTIEEICGMLVELNLLLRGVKRVRVLDGGGSEDVGMESD